MKVTELPITSPSDLDDLLRRAVRSGTITPEQASALAELATRMPGDAGAGDGSSVVPTAPSGWRVAPGPIVAEVLGYVGAAVAFVSGIVLGAELWADLAPWARVGVVALATVTAASAALALGDRRGAVGRLASFLWAVTVAGVAGTVALLTGDLADLASDDAAITTAALTTAAAVAVWSRRRTWLQQAAAFLGVAITGVVALGRIDDSLYEYGGLWVWAVGVAWLLLAHAEVVPPVGAGWVLGSIAVVVGPFMVGDVSAVALALFALVSAVALLVVGSRVKRGPVIGIAVAGVLVHLPRAFSEVFGNAFGSLAVAFVVGVVLLGVAVVAARRIGDEDEPQDDGRST